MRIPLCSYRTRKDRTHTLTRGYNVKHTRTHTLDSHMSTENTVPLHTEKGKILSTVSIAFVHTDKGKITQTHKHTHTLTHKHPRSNTNTQKGKFLSTATIHERAFELVPAAARNPKGINRAAAASAAAWALLGPLGFAYAHRVKWTGNVHGRVPQGGVSFPPGSRQERKP